MALRDTTKGNSRDWSDWGEDVASDPGSSTPPPASDDDARPEDPYGDMDGDENIYQQENEPTPVGSPTDAHSRIPGA